MAYAGFDSAQQKQPGTGGRAKPRRRKTGAHQGADEDSALDPQIQAEIGRHLRDIYQAVLEQPVPERFVDLLADLEQQERKNPG